MLQRRRSIISVGGPRLPYDAELQYLQSVDEQRIALPIACTKVDIKFCFVSSHTQQRVLCASGSSTPGSGSGLAIYQNGNNYLAFSMNADWKTNSVGWSRKVHAVMDSSALKTDLHYAAEGTYTITHNGFSLLPYIVLFDGTNSSINTSRIYSCKLYDAEGIKYDLIPVRKGGVGYLYDKVGGQLWGNEGTGSFILGPDKPKLYSIPFIGIQSDGNAIIKTGYILPQDCSIGAQVGEPTRKTGNQIIFITLDNFGTIESPSWRRTGIIYGGATTASIFQLLPYYNTYPSYAGSSPAMFSNGSRAFDLWLTPKRCGYSSQVTSSFTKGSYYSERELTVAWYDPDEGISSTIPVYTGRYIGPIVIYGSEAQDANSWASLSSYTPIATFQPCVYNGVATMWHVEENRPCTVVNGSFTAIDD